MASRLLCYIPVGLGRGVVHSSLSGFGVPDWGFQVLGLGW